MFNVYGYIFGNIFKKSEETAMNKIAVPESKSVSYATCYRKFTEYNDDNDVFGTEGTFEFLKGISGKVMHQDKYTIVILSDGSKGVAMCMEGDTFSRRKGLRIAYNRAMIQHLEKVTKELCRTDE
jgi:hypothetical protein